MAETTGLLNRRTGHSVPRVRISSSPQPIDSQPTAYAVGCFRVRRTGSSLTGRRARKQPRGPSGPAAVNQKGCPDPRGRQEMPQAQRRGISSILTSSFRQPAAHRHPPWTYKTPHLVRQGPISGNGAPQPPAQRTEAASQCGCLAKSVIVDFFQGHLDRCHFRRTFFDLFWLTVLIQSFFI